MINRSADMISAAMIHRSADLISAAMINRSADLVAAMINRSAIFSRGPCGQSVSDQRLEADDKLEQN